MNPTKTLLLLLLPLLLTTCKKPVRENPLDELAKLDPQEWAPKNIIIEAPTITQRNISWEYAGDYPIEGFKIDRKRGDENWVESYAKLGKEIRSFSDTISPDQSTIYNYKVYAHAGNLKSFVLETSTLAAFPAPTNLSLQKISDISYKINWLDNSDGESGFIIERKTTGPDFIVLDTIDANSTTYTDPNVFIGKAPVNVQYRIKAFYEKYHSDMTEANTNAALTAPSDLEIDRNSVTSVSITWSDNSIGEEGFTIERKHADGEWETISSQSTTTFIDQSFLLNTDVFYRIAAFVGDFKSDFVSKSIDAHIPTPENLAFTINSPTSITLNWDYPTTGHEGFHLERKVNQGNWTVVATGISHDIYNFTDNQIELLENDYSYRISAFVNGLFSDYNMVNYNKTPSVNNPTTGRTWMDRNLGAERIAQSSTDPEAHGDLYQWGRRTDGHEKRTSVTTATLSNSDTPEHGNFIVVDRSPYDWRSPQNNDLWQGVSEKNNPCPMGYRLPTEAEWEAERESWSSNDANGAFNSPLKLTVAGYRNLSNGSLYNTGSIGYYWSASVDGSSARNLNIFDNVAYISSDLRAHGRSVRCIKN